MTEHLRNKLFYYLAAQKWNLVFATLVLSIISSNGTVLANNISAYKMYLTPTDKLIQNFPEAESLDDKSDYEKSEILRNAMLLLLNEKGLSSVSTNPGNFTPNAESEEKVRTSEFTIDDEFLEWVNYLGLFRKNVNGNLANLSLYKVQGEDAIKSHLESIETQLIPIKFKPNYWNETFATELISKFSINTAMGYLAFLLMNRFDLSPALGALGIGIGTFLYWSDSMPFELKFPKIQFSKTNLRKIDKKYGFGIFREDHRDLLTQFKSAINLSTMQLAHLSIETDSLKIELPFFPKRYKLDMLYFGAKNPKESVLYYFARKTELNKIQK